MFKLHKINPMVRAVGTMGAVAALAGGITFATLTSNTVALSPNNLDSATANLDIGLTNGTGCSDRNAGPRTGLNFTGSTALVPGVQSAAFDFCLSNTGTSDLDITTAIPQAVFAGDTGVQPSDVTLDMTCANGGTTHGTLDQYTGGTPVGEILAGASTDCQAMVTLSSGYSGQGGQSVPTFVINFVGTQHTAV